MPGAVNIPAPVIVPQAAPAQPLPERLHVTLVLGEPRPGLVTDELICCAAPNSTLAFCAGEVKLTTTSLVTVAVAVPELPGLATLVARMVTATGEGRICGAVYSPVALIVPTVELPPVMPFTLHVTVVFVVLVTDAVNGCVAPSSTFCVPGATETATAGGGGVTVPPPPPPPHAESRPTSARVTTTHAAWRLALRFLGNWQKARKKSFNLKFPTLYFSEILAQF